ncbi:MAG: hypothetical protein ACRDJG_07755 [Actinomycetota bacterium]
MVRAGFPVVLLAASLALGLASARRIPLRRMNDLGLVSVLPPQFYLALGILTFSFCLALARRPVRGPLLMAHLVGLILMLYGITPLAEGVPRTAVAWRISGIIEHISRTGTVDPQIDAFFNWPGFFIFMAFVTGVTGLLNALPYATWAPIVFNLLYLGPLLLLFTTATHRRDVVWLGGWFFLLANWVGQDYLAPQALNYFFYLTALLIALKWFKTAGADRGVGRHRGRLPSRLVRRGASWLESRAENGSENERSRPSQRAGLVAVLVAYIFAAVASHQLTPLAMLAAFGVLVAFRRITLRGLPLLLGVAIVTWLIFMAAGYLGGHIEKVTEGVGALGENVDASFVNRFQGSPEHRLVVFSRSALSLLVWNLALLGALRGLRARKLSLDFGLLAGAPFLLTTIVAYGGETLLRSYFFSLPFMAFFIATLLSQRDGRRARPLALAGVALGSLVLAAGFLVARYGNERMDYFTPEELSAVDHLYRIAEPGDRILALTTNLPWRYRDYAIYDYTDLTSMVSGGDPGTFRRILRGSPPFEFIILTRGQRAAGSLFFGVPQQRWRQFEDAMRDARGLEVVFENRDAAIFASKDMLETAGAERARLIRETPSQPVQAAVRRVTGVGAGPGYRTLLLLAVLAAPGLFLVRLLRLRDRWLELVLGIALSLALGVIVSVATISLGAGSWLWVAGALIGITLIAVIAGLIRPPSRHPNPARNSGRSS